MFNSKCTCGCLNVDVYGIVLYFVAFWFICVYVYYLIYFWLKLLTGLGGQMFFTSGSVMTQVTGLLPQRSGGQCQARPCGICGGSSDSETGFSQIVYIFPS